MRKKLIAIFAGLISSLILPFLAYALAWVIARSIDNEFTLIPIACRTFEVGVLVEFQCAACSAILSHTLKKHLDEATKIMRMGR